MLALLQLTISTHLEYTWSSSGKSLQHMQTACFIKGHFYFILMYVSYISYSLYYNQQIHNYKGCPTTHQTRHFFNPLNPELNPICYLLALLGAHHFLHVSRITVKLLIFRRLMSYIYIWSTHS